MKANFLRNCNSKNEYILFRENHPEYFESYNVIVGDTIKLSREKLLLLESNTQNPDLWKDIEVKKYICDDENVLCIKVVDNHNTAHSFVFFNGYRYAKYIAYII